MKAAEVARVIKTTINICGKEVPFCSSAAVPRLYRVKFRRDLFRDLKKLQDSYDAKTDSYAIEDLEVFENVTFWKVFVWDNGYNEPFEYNGENNGGIGLEHIVTRAKSVGGRANISAGPDGFTVSVAVPK